VVGDSGGKAFLWTARNGMKSIQDLLSAAGANVTGWQLTSARGVSATCTVITISSQGIDPSGIKVGSQRCLGLATHARTILIKPSKRKFESGTNGHSYDRWYKED
jgi:hypothetical protein